MMRWSSISILCAVAALLASCQAVDLRGPVALDGLRPPGGACDVLADPTFTETHDTLPNCPEREVGLALRPGMVVSIATPTWGPAIGEDILRADQSGTGDDGNPLPSLEIPLAVGARAPQVAAPLRLPIRKLGVNGRLTDEEVAVLGTFLSLQRTRNFGASDDAGAGAANVSRDWRRMLSRRAARAALWNAFVDAASLRRIVPTSEITTDHQPLALVVNPRTFCARAAQPTSGPGASLAVTAAELGLLRTGLFGQDCTNLTRNVEAFALRTDELRADPLAALAVQRGRLNTGYFLDDAVLNPASVVSAELDAVSMLREGAEQRWSLAEWEESGVCGRDRRIERFHVPGLLPAFTVVGRTTPRAATFRVEEQVSGTGVIRRIVSLDGRRHLSTAVASKDLARLRAVDVDYLTWTRPWTGRGHDPCEL